MRMPRQHSQTYDPQEEPAPQCVAPRCSRSRILGRLSRARRTLIVLALISGSAVAGPADPPTALVGQDAARLAQAAQMIVRVTLIGRNCAPFYAVNQAQLQEIGTTLF